MSGMIDCRYLNRMYSPLPENRTVRSTAARTSSFLDMAVRAGRGTSDVLEVSGKPEVSETDETSNVDAYLEHLKKKYGRVTIESIGKDQASLEKAGKRMSGNDVVIAPNILKEMAGDVKKALYYAAKFDTKVIAEEFIDGREIECAVLGNEKPIASGVGEIFSASEFYDYDAKYNNASSKTVVPADLPQEMTNKVREIAIKVFQAVEGSGLARVDFLIQKNTNRIIFNELNTMPGFTSISMYPMLWEAEGKSKTTLIDELISLAFSK